MVFLEEQIENGRFRSIHCSRRMNDDALRFIDDEACGILVEDRERLRRSPLRSMSSVPQLLALCERDLIPGRDDLTRFAYDDSITPDAAFTDVFHRLCA